MVSGALGGTTLEDVRNVAVLGAGSWGTTLSFILSKRSPATLWLRNPALLEQVRSTRRNERYAPDLELPEDLELTSDLPAALKNASVVVLAVPSHGLRGVIEAAGPYLNPDAVLINVAKGIEEHTLLRMSEVVHQVMPDNPLAVLTGPNIASEIAAGLPSASVVASLDETVSLEVQRLFAGPSWRIYTNDDVVGCEIAGAVKNVLALAAGMVEGLRLGDNAKAAVVTRGLAELTRLGVALGGQPLTFSGLAGMGDLFVTCTSGLSRNHHVGILVGKGHPIGQVLAGMDQVAEGVRTAAVVMELARRNHVELPIVEQVASVVAGEITASKAASQLLARQSKPEISGL